MHERPHWERWASVAGGINEQAGLPALALLGPLETQCNGCGKKMRPNLVSDLLADCR
jgi:hypothetical protein